MKVKMLKTESGRFDGFDTTGTGTYQCLTGHTYDVPAKLARAWIRQGVAAAAKAAVAPAKKTAETKKKGVKNGD